MARSIGFIVLPIVLYLWFFWLHFAVLTHSGPGDSFMSPQFQETLRDNEMLLNSLGSFFGEALRKSYLKILPYSRDTILRHTHDQTQRYESLLTFSPRALSSQI